MMNKIGADEELYGVRSKRRCHRILDRFSDLDFYPWGNWFDHGSGASYMRDIMEETYHKKALTTERDLDCVDTTFPIGLYDTITSIELLEHLYNPLWALELLRLALKRDGNLWLVTPNDYSLIYKAEHLLSRKYRPHFHQFCERDLRDILDRAGFKIVRLVKFCESRSGTIARISRNALMVQATKSL